VDNQTVKAIHMLGNKWVILGPTLRRKGALALTNTSAPEAVKPLISALKDENEYVLNAATKALSNLKGAAVDELCSFWCQTRDERIKTIIKKSGYIADSPTALKIKMTFLQEKQITQPFSRDILEDCLMDLEIAICSGAVDYTLTTQKDNALDYLWNFAKHHPGTKIANLLLQRDIYPEDISERALFYFMAGDLAKYLEIDTKHAHLKNWYETSSPELKKDLINLILHHCDKGLISKIQAALDIHHFFPAKEAVNLQMDEMIKLNNLSGLFDLLPFATYDQGSRIICTIQKAGWIHPHAHLQELQERLQNIFNHYEEGLSPLSYANVIFQDFRPMFFTGENLPENEMELVAWAQNKNNFRQRSAAVIAMIERGSPNLKDVANRACVDEYWQVRMAAAAAEMSHPGTLSPSNRALLSKDHVYWVQVLLNIPSDGRLCDLSPADLDAYRKGGPVTEHRNKSEKSDNFYTRMTAFIHPSVREYLLTLDEYNEYFYAHKCSTSFI
jgi:hypothetical protein